MNHWKRDQTWQRLVDFIHVAVVLLYSHNHLLQDDHDEEYIGEDLDDDERTLLKAEKEDGGGTMKEIADLEEVFRNFRVLSNFSNFFLYFVPG